MMQDLCLLRRTLICPGESLNSYLARLAKLNSYYPPGMLSEHAIGAANELGQVRDRINLPTWVTTYEQLAILTRTDATHLYASTTHKFAPVLTPPEGIIPCISFADESVSLLPSGIASKQLRPTQAAQFCPVCLKNLPYHRLIWTPIAVSACLEHKCLLLTNCHSCGKKVSVHDIVTAQCDDCKSSLTEAETQSLETDEFGLFSQYLIQSWLNEQSNSSRYHSTDACADSSSTLQSYRWIPTGNKHTRKSEVALLT